MATSAKGPRVLLRRLREVMAEPGTSQQARLDRIASLIAANMVAEVCSIYVKRPGEVLELFATEGLRPEAVHRTTLKVGEGLVGLIAAEANILNLADAHSHPAFKYLPETGEELYNSFLGVPILRSGLTVGVLVVQNRVARQYHEEEEEALQTTAMVLAEVIASGPLEDVAQAADADIRHVRSHHLRGESLVEGIALGHVVLHEPRVVITRFIAESTTEELARLEAAVSRLREHVDSLIDGDGRSGGAEFDDILETFRMFAYDRGWVRRLREAVETGLTAEAAVERVQSDTRARMARQADPYLRERLHDLDDLANRLLRILTGAHETAAHGSLPRDAIVVARNMGPAELLDYDRARLRGVILEEGGHNSHVAIVARALGLPALGQVRGIIDLVDTGDPVIADGGSGEVFVRPSPGIEQAYAEKVRLYARRQARYTALRGVAPVSKDGVPVSLQINAGLVVDLPHLGETAASGIGLFRTELQFMMARAFPRFGEQTGFYRKVLEAAGGKPVVFRSLDIGSDKVLPYLHAAKEENPAMGWRAIRMALDRPALLRLQLRALLSAGSGRELNVMFPMVSDVGELRRARELVEREKAFLAARGHVLPERVRLGAMIEVPALLWQLDQFLPETDFVSIGSNDLVQFLFAADRGHPRLAGRYDPLSPAVLRAIAGVVERCAAYKVPLNLCGEMAGRPIEAMALIGIGLRSISMAPAAVGPVKSMLLALDVGRLEALLRPLVATGAETVRGALMAFAAAEGIPL